MGLPIWDIRKLLEIPEVYNFFQKLVHADRPRRQFFKEYIAPSAGSRVLEVGCGPGTNCEWLPKGIDYVGCDLNKDYIAFAKKHYSPQAEFYAAPVGQLANLGLKPFDIVIAFALLHHLNDNEISTLCDEIDKILKPGGLFISADPCFTVEQSKIERFITSCDRGRFVRFPQEYKALLENRFNHIKLELKRGELLIPNTGLIMIAQKQ